MGKDDKEETGFGFKDKAKAEETLKLLESHDMNYRRLTVRGLLGRAKRVLSLTKAEDKIRNIKEAMEVFENWTAELEKSKQSDNKKKEKEDTKKENKKNDEDSDEDSSDSDEEMEEKPKEKKEAPSDTVPGLGFKDKETAEGSLKVLEGRDPDYQKLAVKGLIGRAKRVLTCTRDETKVSSIKEAVSVFDKFLDDFDTLHLGRQNNAYLALGLVNACVATAEERALHADEQKPFIEAYRKVNGEYKKLRTVPSKDDGPTWDIVRNAALKELKEQYAKAKLFNDKDEPTDDHLQMLLWAYSPDAARCKKCIRETKSDAHDRKRRSSGDAHDRKRRSSGAGDGSANKSKRDE